MGEAIHVAPARRDRADFILGVDIPEASTKEQLWAKDLHDGTFEICCIPFFTYGLALGDIVETDPAFNITRVVQPSGHFTFRVWFKTDSRSVIEEVEAELKQLASELEWSSRHLLALDAADAATAERVAEFLRSRQGEAMEYEAG